MYGRNANTAAGSYNVMRNQPSQMNSHHMPHVQAQHRQQQSSAHGVGSVMSQHLNGSSSMPGGLHLANGNASVPSTSSYSSVTGMGANQQGSSNMGNSASLYQQNASTIARLNEEMPMV